MTDEWIDNADGDARALLTKAELLASETGYGANLDPAHLALALFNEDEWSLDAFGSPGITARELREDLAARAVDKCRSASATANVLRLAQANARRSGRELTSAFDIALATWLAPGPHQRLLVRTRGRVMPVLRVSADAARFLDGVRLVRTAAIDRLRQTLASIRDLAQRGPAGWLYTTGRLVGRLVRWLVHATSFPITIVFTAPGIAVREGSRAVIARLLGSSRRGKKLYDSLVADFDAIPTPTPWRHATILLLPNAICFAVGLLWLIPPVVRRDALGIPIAPAITERANDIGAVEETELFARLYDRSFPVWIAVACLFLALPRYEQIRQARWELQLSGPVGRGASWGVWPIQALARIGSLFDPIFEYAGLPVVIGSGLVGVAAGMVVSEPLARLLV